MSYYHINGMQVVFGRQLKVEGAGSEPALII